MVWIALAGVVALFGVATLANDVGALWGARLKMQTAADAAALAAATSLLSGGLGDYNTEAQAAATSNGFTDGEPTPTDSNLVTVIVHNPPVTGNYTQKNMAVEVDISQNQPGYFMRVLGLSSVPVSVRAVASSVSASGCIYATNPSSSTGFLANSGAHITSTCGLLVNSTGSSALSVDSGAHISAGSVGVVGNAMINSGAHVSPTPVSGIAVFGDPLGGLATPATSGSCTTLQPVNSGNTANLSPGYYCGLNANSGSTVNLAAGNYSFDGSVNIDSGSSLNGTGVMLYFQSGTIQINSGARVDLSAPTSGTYSGILFFQDRQDSTPPNLDSGAQETLTGALYFPDATITLNSGNWANIYSILVASNIVVNSGAKLIVNSDYSSLANGSPIQRAALVE